MDLKARIGEITTGFARSFWVANTLELFERLAYYGTQAILAVYLAETVGLGREEGTFMMGTFGLMIYLLPILAGVFVDRFGFRRTLMACFAIFSVGYFLIGLAALPAGQALVALLGRKTYLWAALLLTSVGGSLIKPCVVGTCAKTSRPEVRSLGFSIYYTLVNLGAAVAPFLAAGVRREFGIEYVLVTSSLISVLNFAGTLFFFTEPEHHDGQEEKRSALGKVFSDMLLVFLNFRFILFLVIFSSFWIIFWQMYLTLPFYTRDVLKLEAWETLPSVEAITVILMSVPITALVKRWSPITAMVAGFVIGSGSWLVMAFSGSAFGASVALALLAIGEATQAPRFYEYVSALAPKDQVGTFMGFAFLPIAIGYFTSGWFSGWLLRNYMNPEGTMNPMLMWVWVAGVGFAGAALLFAYNMLFVKKAGAAA